ncbi:NUDIX hydrolase [Ornithinimicrobium avium]|uniref:NUDIX hydrolase n=1 Tax=Ornithinimicrobium avium TaxID=2283195 RepID=UPI0013B382CE|nr:NUDIX hydrolase [Ornithinimicrobium avium]
MDLQTVRRKAGTAALVSFRLLPGPLKRAAVRIGAPTYTAGAVCVLEHDGEVLVLWQPHRLGWSLPGGLLGRGEAPAEAVRREVAEEIGIDIDPGDPVVVRVDHVEQGIDVVFHVRLDARPQLSLATEARKARWFAPGELTEHQADRDTRGILETLRTARDAPRPGRLIGPAAQD